MNVISSQRYLDPNTVDEKLEELKGKASVTLPVVLAGEWEGQELYILIDGHHTAEAARELGIEIEYKEHDRREYNWDDRWTLDEALEAHYMDSEWYFFETGQLVF